MGIGRKIGTTIASNNVGDTYKGIISNPNVASELNLLSADIQALSNGETPEGYTWHHHEEPGVLQLVDEEVHNQTSHSGGRFIWGGGTENR